LDGPHFIELKHWYYDAGNAMHLSLKTSNDFLKGLQYLQQAPSKQNLHLLQRIFSSVRTHIKEDLGVYDASDVSKPIPDYETALADGTIPAKPKNDE